ncbi:MAG TPA: GTPase domain-containing protein [Pirellulales bacterium]|jgi:ABC-type multidrug transport system fused ATPase/permease subunit|nr:GTPase domain-containing protein [Pirellulales bacterium]
MPGELAHLELLAEVDALVGELRDWSRRAPPWPPARQAQALLHRLEERIDTLRLRLEAPLVVATLGGTGTGKSALVNALAGATVTSAGRQRPTTRQPVLVCRPEVAPAMLGISTDSLQVVHASPALRDLVLVDCPDPDTTEDAADPASNVARLRSLLPHCDVLLVTTTQQKYRSARVSAELAAAAPGARIVFVQTHADTDDDIREDWRQALGDEYAVGEMFFVDSLEALGDAEAGLEPRGEFGRLVQLLTRQLAGAAGNRIRRANFLDLVEQTLATVSTRLDTALPVLAQLDQAITEQRARLVERLGGQLRDDLLERRRTWEQRLVAEVAGQWGFSPFACVLRAYQGLGGLLSGAALLRVRTPAQMALWGTIEGARRLRNFARDKAGELTALRAEEFRTDDGELRTAAIIIGGYAAEAGLDRQSLDAVTVEREAAEVAGQLIRRASADVQEAAGRLARRHTGWLTRVVFESLLGAMLVVLLYRFVRNFFYDSWLAPQLGLAEHAQPLLGTDFFLAAAFVLAGWCGLLLWVFTNRLRQGFRGETIELARLWNTSAPAGALFGEIDAQVRAIRTWRQELKRLSDDVADLKDRIEQPEPLSRLRQMRNA